MPLIYKIRCDFSDVQMKKNVSFRSMQNTHHYANTMILFGVYLRTSSFDRSQCENRLLNCVACFYAQILSEACANVSLILRRYETFHWSVAPVNKFACFSGAENQKPRSAPCHWRPCALWPPIAISSCSFSSEISILLFPDYLLF